MQDSRMGGIEYNSVHLAERLDRRRFEIVFLCPGEGKLTAALRQKSLPLLFYTRPPFISTSIYLFGRYIFNPFATFYNLLTFPIIILGLTRILRREKFDLAVTKGLVANFYGAAASKMAGIVCVWDAQEIVSRQKFFGLMLFGFNLWARFFVDRVIVPAEAVRDQFWKSLRAKTVLIPNGIDTDRYHPRVDAAPVRQEWGIRSDEILIAHVARFTYWKGQKDFVRAAALLKDKIPNAKFALVGSPVFENDTYEKEVKKMAANMGLNGRIFFPGFRKDLEQILAAADIFVHSSIEPEGCPLTLITAMAMGKPCVATNIAGNDEIISEPGRQALLVAPRNPEAIADAVIKIAKNHDFFQSLQQGARRRILERYTLNVYAKNSEKVFGLPFCQPC